MSTATLASAIVATLRSRRFPITSERAAQDAIATAFSEDGLAVEREKLLGSAGRVDFYALGIAVEIKVGVSGGSKREVYRQLKRYADHPEVTIVVLATNVAVELPPLAKPVTVVSLGRAWL